MKFAKAWIDGYGRFTNQEIGLTSGVQIVAGPNEQGKSTFRHFLADMLYGQKRGPGQRAYDAANELRAPWNGANGYGGRILYLLDNGREIEVQRSFERKSEKVRVFDKTHAEDITGQFPTLKNREVAFAEAHVGLPKEAFLGAATISHMTLEDLGDSQALTKIREKILSLTDSGGGERSAESALEWLADRIASVGQKAARTKPLPMARNRLFDLQKEYEQSVRTRKEAEAIVQQRVAVLGEISDLERARSALDAELALREQIERAARLEKIEALSARIDELTRESFRDAVLKQFPIDSLASVQRLTALADRARDTIARSETELTRLQRDLEREVKRLGEDGDLRLDDVDPVFEARLGDLESRISRDGERLDEFEEALATAKQRLDTAQAELDALPDFSRLSADPVEWLTQLASSFNVAVKAREDERAELLQIGEGVSRKSGSISRAAEAFEGIENFSSLARDYETATRENAAAIAQLTQEGDHNQALARENAGHIQEFGVAGALTSAVCAAAAGTAAYVKNPGIFIPAFIFGIMAFIAIGAFFYYRRAVRKGLERNEYIRDEIARIRIADGAARETIDDLMLRARCETSRELEAMYDQYRQDAMELSMLQLRCSEQELAAAEAGARVEKLFERLRETFERVGESLASAEDVPPAAKRAIGRYQEYRDAKRRAGEAREILQRREKDIHVVRKALDAARQDELDISLTVRQLLRGYGYREEQKLDSALRALQGYRIRAAQLRRNQSQVEVLRGKIGMIEERLHAEREGLARHESSLQEIFESAGVTSVPEFVDKAERARAYQQVWNERAGLEAQFDAVLGGEDLATLRKLVESDASAAAGNTRPFGEIRSDLVRVNDDIDTRRRREHALHIAITDKLAGVRSTNEVDEERAEVEQQMRDLELELQAASYAASIIEDVSRERHARIAPKLAKLASDHFKEITGGAYDELLIDKDLRISVRIPQTKTIDQNPSERLSKGTVDQIYLSLRLALVEMLSERGERIPMLLDDPFANYDDARLARAMKLLVEVGKRNQVLLFTCREDVVRAAEKVSVPVIRL